MFFVLSEFRGLRVLSAYLHENVNGEISNQYGGFPPNTFPSHPIPKDLHCVYEFMRGVVCMCHHFTKRIKRNGNESISLCGGIMLISSLRSLWLKLR